MAAPSFAFNQLVQPSSTVIQTTPTGFDASKAYLLASAIDAVIQAYLQNQSSLPAAALSALPLVGGAASYAQIGSLLTASEANGPGAMGSSTPGAYATVTIGAALQALDSNSNPLFTVIALRGTQTYQEWVNDLNVLPASYGLVSGAGWVHGGFYSLYTTGTDGLQPQSSTSRAAGSLAAQIYQAITGGGWPSNLPIYVTGHSLGAALAEICAMDVASNMATAVSSVTMLNFAPPQLSAGLLYEGSPYLDPTQFAQSYQSAVQNSYSVVNAADLVPILPPGLGSASGYQVVFYPVVSSSNVVTYCAQTGSIAGNHELITNYLPYTQQLAGGFADAVAAAPVFARRARGSADGVGSPRASTPV
jgi:hypothetical protein